MPAHTRTCENCSSSRVIASGYRQGQLACVAFPRAGCRVGSSCLLFTPESEAFRLPDFEGTERPSHRLLVKSDVESQNETN